MTCVDEEGAILSRLSAIRIAIAAIYLVRMTPLVALVPGATHEHVFWGWPDGRWTTTLGFVLSAAVVRALVVTRTLATTGLLVGVRSRWMGVIAGISGLFVLTQDAFAATHTLRLLVVASAIVAVDGGCARALLPDRPIDARSSLRLLQAFVASIYVWSALAKLDGDWLSGRTLAAFNHDGLIAGLGASAWLTTASRCRATAIAVLFVELSLGPALLHPRTRRIALVAAVVFHAALEITVRPDVFGLAMIALLASFAPLRARSNDQNAVDSGKQPPPSHPRAQ